MTAPDRILPCPFCGGDDFRKESNIMDGVIQCRSCGAMVCKDHENKWTEDGFGLALQVWNTRSHSNALVAAAYEAAGRAAFRAGKTVHAGYVDENSRLAQRIENELRLEVQKAIRARTPADAKAALDAIKAEVRREALQEAANKADEFKAKDMWEMRDAGHDYCAAASHIHAAILALMEKDT